jgi:hypothetical protein
MEERADEGASCLGVGGGEGEDRAVAGLPRGRPARPRPGAAFGATGGKSSTTIPWRLEGDARLDPGAFKPAPGAFSPPGGRTPAGLAAGLDVGLGAMAGGALVQPSSQLVSCCLRRVSSPQVAQPWEAEQPLASTLP